LVTTRDIACAFRTVLLRASILSVMGRGAAPLSLLVALIATSCAGGANPLDQLSKALGSSPPAVTAKPAPIFWVNAPIAGDPSPLRAHVPNTGALIVPGGVQLLPPPIVPGPRRVAIQAGHWKTDEAPDDAFVSLHVDDDGGVGTATGFKIAHGFYRGPYDNVLVDALTTAYAAMTGLPLNDQITDDMTDYYAFAWFRYEHALAPHTPAAIVEMGYLSNSDDRALLVDDPGVVAQGVANGVLRFLAANSREALFANAIAVPTVAAPVP